MKSGTIHQAIALIGDLRSLVNTETACTLRMRLRTLRSLTWSSEPLFQEMLSTLLIDVEGARRASDSTEEAKYLFIPTILPPQPPVLALVGLAAFVLRAKGSGVAHRTRRPV